MIERLRKDPTSVSVGVSGIGGHVEATAFVAEQNAKLSVTMGKLGLAKQA